MVEVAEAEDFIVIDVCDTSVVDVESVEAVVLAVDVCEYDASVFFFFVFVLKNVSLVVS